MSTTHARPTRPRADSERALHAGGTVLRALAVILGLLGVTVGVIVGGYMAGGGDTGPATAGLGLMIGSGLWWVCAWYAGEALTGLAHLLGHDQA